MANSAFARQATATVVYGTIHVCGFLLQPLVCGMVQVCVLLLQQQWYMALFRCAVSITTTVVCGMVQVCGFL